MSDKERQFLTLGIDLEGVSVLVVGGGVVGLRKAGILVAHGALVTVVDPRPSAALEAAATAGEVRCTEARYAVEHLAGHSLIIAATDDAEVNRRIAAHARAGGQLCCLVSDSANSQVLFPAMHRWGDVTVALHTNAQSCKRAVAAREHLAGLPAPPLEDVTPGGRDAR